MIPLIPLLIGGGLIALAVITISKLINIIKGRFPNAVWVKITSNKIKSNLDNGNANVLKLGLFDGDENKLGKKLGKDKIEGKFDEEIRDLRKGDWLNLETGDVYYK
ncbi:MAG: hypothetical protein IKA37_04475 [Spirochaetales bacterium]|nr:hypothetical protein [Spirochaetales bacterium]